VRQKRERLRQSTPFEELAFHNVVTALLASFALRQGSIKSVFGVLVTTAILLLPKFVADAEVYGDCKPVLEVDFEALPYYLGSIAEYHAKVDSPDHCHQDFPEFPCLCCWTVMRLWKKSPLCQQIHCHGYQRHDSQHPSVLC
jgi:hypothetical protein